MAFKYRKSLLAEGVIPVHDFPIDATYAATAKPGDIVRLDGSGNVIKAVTGDTTVLGVLEGTNFEGLEQTRKVAKVRTSGQAVYEASVVGAGAITKGTSYGIDSSGNLDTADTTTLIAKIVDVVGGKPYVVITARQLA